MLPPPPSPSISGFGSGCASGPHKTALDAHGPIMIEDHQGPAPPDVGRACRPLSLKLLDSASLAETRIDPSGSSSALHVVRQVVELACAASKTA